MNGLGVSLWLVDVAVLDEWKAKLGSVLMSACEYTKSAKKVNGGKEHDAFSCTSSPELTTFLVEIEGAFQQSDLYPSGSVQVVKSG